jgi:hypothetical protein
MATEMQLLEVLNTEQAVISTADLAAKVQSGVEGTRKQLNRLKDKGKVTGDSEEGWLITEEGKKALGAGGIGPSMISEGVTPRQKFEAFGHLIGIKPDRVTLATHIVWSGDYNDLKWVWDALGQADIDVDLRRVWTNSWRAHLKKGIPSELEKELVGAEEEREVKAGAKPRVEEGRSYILVEDSPVYVGKNLGDLLYEDAVDLARIRAGRAARGAVQGAPSQQWGARDIIEIVNAVRDWAPGQAPSKSYMVTQGEGGAIVQEVEPGKPMVLQQPASKPATYLVKPDGSVKQMEPGEPIVVTQQAPTPTKTFIVKQTPEGATVEEHDISKPIIISALAPTSAMSPMYPFPAMEADGKQMYDKDGNLIYVNIEPMLKYWGFMDERKRANERHNALMGLTQTIKENLPIGIEAFSRAVGEVKGKAPESAVQQYECGQCHTKFTLPREPGEDEKVICPSCRQEWTGKEVLSA